MAFNPAVNLTNAGRGRKPGSRNKRTLQRDHFCDMVFGPENSQERADFAAEMRKQFLAGTLAPHIAQTLLWWWMGKPKEEVNVRMETPDFAQLSDEQLAERARFLADVVAGERALPEASIIDVTPQTNEGTNEGTNETKDESTRAA